ncbi:MAG: electron transport complex subunit E [Spirochaetes bacterium]|nr:electron transport complex subunit E [Spirochaetota bacterium]
MTSFGLLKRGIIEENPVFVKLLGLCPLLAVTTSATNGLAMGLATTAVMVSACVVVSILRSLIPAEVRLASFVVVIAGFVTIVQLLMAAYMPPAINDALGIFIPLIVVNCIVLSRAELFASKNNPFKSAIDAFGVGLGFTVALISIGLIREFLGAGTLFEIELNTNEASHVLVMIMAPGAFFTMGALIMAMNYYRNKKGGADK